MSPEGGGGSCGRPPAAKCPTCGHDPVEHGIRLGRLVPAVALSAPELAGAVVMRGALLARVAEHVRALWQGRSNQKRGMRLTIELDVPPEPGDVAATLTTTERLS